MDDKLQQLPVEERIKLVEPLWDNIAADQHALALMPDQKSALDERLDAYAVDENRDHLTAEAIADIRPRLLAP